MDARATERECQTFHGLVSAMPQAWFPLHGAGAALVRPLLAALVAACLAAALTGGLLRLGVVLPWAGTAWAGHAAAAHGALMIPAFFAAVIGIERAVAIKLRWAFAVPIGAAAAGLAHAVGLPQAAAWIALAASLVFVGVNVEVVRRQPQAHSALLLASAVCLLAGNLASLGGGAPEATLGFWFAFLAMTIAAERLEMTRLMRRRPGVQATLLAILALLAGAPAVGLWQPLPGGVLYGAALLMLALWLGAFDIARRTVRAQGLARYMAVCLLAGYAWLAAAGVAWAATSMGLAGRDLALHGLGLGFVFSMVLGHAPVILPAVARIKLAFHRGFYLPLAVLHLSLVWRFAVEPVDFAQRAMAARWNAIALVLFALMVVFAALRWRVLHKR